MAAPVLATPTLGAGWATFGLALPRGAAMADVQVGALQTQADRKNSHPDGSWKFGLVTTKIVTPGALPITAVPRGDAAPLAGIGWPTVAVTFTIAGVPYVATAPTGPTENRWLTGPLVRESRAIVAPVAGGPALLTAVRAPDVDQSLGAADDDGADAEDQADHAADPWDVTVAQVAEATHALGWGEAAIPSDDGARLRATAAVTHPALQVVFDVRSYLGGGHRVDVTVQNSRDSSGAVGVIYDVAITIDGSVVFSRTNIAHHWRRCWRRVFAAQGFTEAAVTHDFEPAIQAGLLERFRPSVADLRYPIDDPKFDILQFGTMFNSMGAPGGRACIGPYPWWTAQFLVHQRADQRAHMLRCGELAGSWNARLYKADGASLIRLDQTPTYSWGSGPTAHAAADPPNMGPIYDVDATHCPSLCYVPYLVTGDRFFCDMQKAWANHILISVYTGDAYAFGADVGGLRSDRSLAVGALFPRSTEPRGAAWGFRELLHAAVACPDDDPDQLYFQVCVKNNLLWWEAYGNRPAQGYYNAAFGDFDPGQLHAGFACASQWQAAYLAWVIDYANRQGFGPGQSLVRRIYTTQIKLMDGRAFDPAYGASVYYARYGTYTGYVPGVPGTGTHRWFTTAQEFYDANFGHPTEINSLDFDPGLTKSVPLSPGYIEGYYGSDYRILLLMGVRDGAPGAREALAWLESYKNGAVLGDIDWRSGFALQPFGASATPLPIPIPDPPPVTTPPVTIPPTGTPTRSMVITLTATQDQTNIDPAALNYRIVAPVVVPTPIPPVPTGQAQTRVSASDLAGKPLAGPYAAGQVLPAELIAINVGTADASHVMVTPHFEGAAIVAADSDAYDMTTGKWTVGDLPHSTQTDLKPKQIGVTVKVQD